MSFEKIKVLTFAKGNFIEAQKILKVHLQNIGIINQIHLTDSDLPLDFKKNFEEILSCTKGYGYCIWKPFIILENLNKLKNDETLLYIDSTDLPSINFFKFILTTLIKDDYVFLNRGYIHGNWTKRDTFILMNCDNEIYHNHVQLEAGVMALKPTEFNINLIEEWFNYCTNKHILTEIPNICSLPDLEGFREHRYDQSILTNLIINKNITSHFLDGNFIKYNFNQPKKYS